MYQHLTSGTGEEVLKSTYRQPSSPGPHLKSLLQRWVLVLQIPLRAPIPPNRRPRPISSQRKPSRWILVLSSLL